MKRTFVILLLAAWLAIPVATHASPPPPQSLMLGEDLYRLCTSSSDLDYGMCAGYVTAVANLLAAGPVAGRNACNFSQPRSQEFMDLVIAHIEHNPETKSRPAYEAVAAAMSQAFRCQ